MFSALPAATQAAALANAFTTASAAAATAAAGAVDAVQAPQAPSMKRRKVCASSRCATALIVLLLLL